MSATPPPDLRARVLEAARREPSPTRAETARRARTAIALAALATVAAFAAFGGFRWNRAPAIVIATGIGAALVALAATWGAAARGGSMLGRPRGALVAVALAGPLAFLGWSIAVTTMEPAGITLDGGARALQHAICFGLTATYALAPFVAALVAKRGSDPVHPRALGAALGAAAGLWGGVLIDVHCPNDAVAHLALGHAAPILALAAIGALVGARVLGVRARGAIRGRGG